MVKTSKKKSTELGYKRKSQVLRDFGYFCIFLPILRQDWKLGQNLVVKMGQPIFLKCPQRPKTSRNFLFESLQKANFEVEVLRFFEQIILYCAEIGKIQPTFRISVIFYIQIKSRKSRMSAQKCPVLRKKLGKKNDHRPKFGLTRCIGL